VITSTANSRVKYARSLYRRPVRHREKRFVVEGVRLVEEMVKTGQEPVFFFYTEDAAKDPRARSLIDGMLSSDVETALVSQEVMGAMSDTRTPQGILAIAGFPEWGAAGSDLVLVLDRVRDPGNLGTILRTAQAAGVGLVITLRGTVDVFSPKVVRGAMGAHFRLAIAWDCHWEDVRRTAQRGQVLLATPRGGQAYYDLDWTGPTTVVVGGEARGAGREAHEWATGLVSVPMADAVESLNVAVASSVILFEAARQRREGRLGQNR
jgi:TrmH family RNA methyltransferase